MARDEESYRVGLIGLGNAGGAMLQALAVHSTVTVFDRNPDRLAEVATACVHAPVAAASAAQVADGCDCVILSLPTPEASLSVARELLGHLRPGATVVECSTVSDKDVEALHDLLAGTGTRVIDAPLVGGVHKLAEGKAVFLIGASESDAGIAGQVLGSIAEEVFYLGQRGGGMKAKLIVNGVAHAAYVVLVEAGALAASQDVPLPILQRLLERESGLLRPLTHRFGERLGAHDFAGGMSTANALKDSGLVLAKAEELGIPLFATAAAHGVYEQAMQEGLAALDYAAIGTLWEKWLGISLKR